MLLPRLWRSFQQVWAARQHVLPEPDVLILGQGTRIMYQTPSHLQEDLQWRLKLDAGWSRPAMEAAVAACVQRHGRKALRYAPGGEQNNHRLALLLDAAQLDALSAELRASLRGRKAGKARLGYRMVVRQARPAGSGSGSGLLAVDLVPALAGKGAALQHVMRRFHIPRQSVVAVGSGSQDVSLLEQASHAIIAGRADPVLEDWARQQRAQQPASASGRSPAPWGQGASDAGHAARVGSAQQQQQQQWHRQQPQHGTSVDAPGPTVVVLSRQLGALGLLEGLEQLRSIES